MMARLDFVKMEEPYIHRFIEASIEHHTTGTQRALGCAHEKAREFTLAQLSGIVQRNVPGSSYLVSLKDGDVILGGVWYQAQSGQSAKVYWIMVEEEFQRQGHGKRLMSHVMRHCQSVGALGVGLYSFAENNAAAALYRQCGFVVIGEERYVRL